MHLYYVTLIIPVKSTEPGWSLGKYTLYASKPVTALRPPEGELVEWLDRLLLQSWGSQDQSVC